MRVPLWLRVPPWGYGFEVTGTNKEGLKTTRYVVIGSKEARRGIRTNVNHVKAGARLSAEYSFFHELTRPSAQRINVIRAWINTLIK